MWKALDLIGQTFGRLTVIKRVPKPEGLKRNSAYWLCKCSCNSNKETIICTSNLRSGLVRSCGCLAVENCSNVGKLGFDDISGNKYGRLTVIDFSHKETKEYDKSQNKYYWNCQCDCHGENSIIVARSDSLKNGDIQSCGCLSKESNRNRKLKGYGEATYNSVIRAYKDGAKRKNIDFCLDNDYFFYLTQQDCFYCGRHPIRVRKSRNDNGDFLYNGIDRIDSSKGYTKDNCVSCCTICNIAKNNLDIKDFYEWVFRLYNNLSNNRKDEIDKYLNISEEDDEEKEI